MWSAEVCRFWAGFGLGQLRSQIQVSQSDVYLLFRVWNFPEFCPNKPGKSSFPSTTLVRMNSGHFPNPAISLICVLIWSAIRTAREFIILSQRWPRSFPMPQVTNTTGGPLAVRIGMFSGQILRHSDQTLASILVNSLKYSQSNRQVAVLFLLELTSAHC
jgi:hypothetical protein